MLLLCAFGGMLMPALIYALFNWSEDSLVGWGIPIATDTAFALGALTLMRNHIPVSLLAFVVGHAQIRCSPHRCRRGDLAERAGTPLRRWEDAITLPVSLLILPLFALANAGIVLSVDGMADSLQHHVGLGIIVGLVLGKFVGISGACWLGLRFGIGKLPERISLKHVVGVSLVSGIGFTMSTFIAALGFDAQPDVLQHAKTAVLMASVISAALGMAYIRMVSVAGSSNKGD